MNIFLLITFTQEKFGREEGRLALLAPLPTIEATIYAEKNLLLFTGKYCFVAPYTFFLVSRTLTRCYISYRFRGFPCLITPYLLPISNSASASLFWKSTGSHRFPNLQQVVYSLVGFLYWSLLLLICIGT